MGTINQLYVLKNKFKLISNYMKKSHKFQICYVNHCESLEKILTFESETYHLEASKHQALKLIKNSET